LNHTVNDLFYEMSVFNDAMDTISPDSDEAIINVCLRLEHFLSENGFLCRRYDVYKEDWFSFEFGDKSDISEKTLYELCIYLFIYQREEHMSGGYGGSYVRAFRNGTIPIIVNELVRRLELMVLSSDNDSDKSGTIGISGEYFVMAELTRMGYVASLTSKNTKAIDLIISDKTGQRFASIQVKASNNPVQKTWKLGKGVESNISSNLYYVFVNLNKGAEPSYYIVPSKYVAYRVKQDYEKWYNTPGKKKQQRNETDMRTFTFVDREEADQYRNAWYLLGI